MSSSETRDYSGVTEQPGDEVRPEAVRMLQTRYGRALDFCRDGDVLELACGPGQGLRLLKTQARRVVGADVTASLIDHARDQLGPGISLCRCDAQHLPFADHSFDAVFLLEAIYYLKDPVRAVRDIRRVLRPGGVVFVCCVNPEWRDFVLSAHSFSYYSAAALQRLFEPEGFAVRVEAAFEAEHERPVRRLVGMLKRVAGRLHLIPATMSGKRWLKRLFYGRLASMPSAVSLDPSLLEPLTPFDSTQPGRFKVLYMVAELREPSEA